MAYAVVLLLFFGVIPLAFTEDGQFEAKATLGPQMLLLVIPILAAAFIARSATVVDSDGITVHAVFGSRQMGWDEIRGLSVERRTVYAVLAHGAMRLPCVRVADLAALSRASGGHVPAVADPKPKFAPSRRRR